MDFIADWLSNGGTETKDLKKAKEKEQVEISGDKALATVREHFDCAICRSPLKNPVQTTCGHLFCNFCLEEQCRRNPSCPLCKSRISTRGVIQRDDVEDLNNVVRNLCDAFGMENEGSLKGNKENSNPKKEQKLNVTAPVEKAELPLKELAYSPPTDIIKTKTNNKKETLVPIESMSSWNSIDFVETWLSNSRKDSKLSSKESGLESIKEHLDCVKCRSSLNEPVQASCGHLFCKFCLEEQCLQSALCPICKSKISSSELFDRKDVEDLKIAIANVGIRVGSNSRKRSVNDSIDPVGCKTNKDAEHKAFQTFQPSVQKPAATNNVVSSNNEQKLKLTSKFSSSANLKFVENWVNNNTRKNYRQTTKNVSCSIEKALENVQRHFECEICQCTLRAPVVQASCEHLFCQLCVEEKVALGFPLCPACDSEISMDNLVERCDVEDLNNNINTNLCFHSVTNSKKEYSKQTKSNNQISEAQYSTFNSLPQHKKHYVFCPTRLNKAQISKLQELCNMCNGMVSFEFNSEVTHLIINLSNGRVPQTLKYLLAIAGRKWVIIFDWVDKCIDEGILIPEEDYETSNFKQCDPGVKLSRLSETNLFQDFNFYFASDSFKKALGFTLEEVMMLMTTLGARVLNSPEEFRGSLLIVGCPRVNETEYYHWLHTKNWITITFEWIIQCILEYKLQPLLKSHLCVELTHEALQSANVPKPLLKVMSSRLFSQTR